MKTTTEVRAAVCTLLIMKKAASPQKAAWIETEIDAILQALMQRKLKAACARATAALANAT